MRGRLIAVAAMALAGMATAETAPEEPGVSPRFVKPPAPGERPRVTVQITPEDMERAWGPLEPREPRAQTPTPGEGATPPDAGRHAWFWEAVSPGRAQGGPGRLDAALAALGRASGDGAVRAPRLQSLQKIARAHGAAILRATAGTRVSPALVLAVISVESGGRADAVSRAGAEGLMQLIPATAARFGVTDSFDTAQNIDGGVAYLDWLMRRFDGDPMLVLAGYNAGEGAVDDHAGVPPFAETRDYVPKVLAAYEVARGLCITPPMFLSDGCVFATNVAANGN